MICVLTTSGVVYSKSGSLSGGWNREAKEGGVSATWTNEHSRVTQVAAAG